MKGDGQMVQRSLPNLESRYLSGPPDSVEPALAERAAEVECRQGIEPVRNYLLTESLFDEPRVRPANMERFTIDVIRPNRFQLGSHLIQVVPEIRARRHGREYRSEDHAHVQPGLLRPSEDFQPPL